MRIVYALSSVVCFVLSMVFMWLKSYEYAIYFILIAILGAIWEAADRDGDG